VQNKALSTNPDLALSLDEGEPSGHTESPFYQRVSCSIRAYPITSTVVHLTQSVHDFNTCGARVCVMLFGHKHKTFSASIFTGVASIRGAG
jgi:hypothetical protein